MRVQVGAAEAGDFLAALDLVAEAVASPTDLWGEDLHVHSPAEHASPSGEPPAASSG